MSQPFGSFMRRTRAFTLVELMIVIAIIALLIAILIPSLARAREQAKQVACAANLKTIFNGIFYYANDRHNGNGYLPMFTRGIWSAQIAPYVKVKRTRLGAKRGVFVCPADEHPRLRNLSLPRAYRTTLLPTERDKLIADARANADGSRRRGNPAGGRVLGELIEPVSYQGNCQAAVEDPTPGALFGSRSRRLTQLKRPHCYVLLTETLASSSEAARCFLFQDFTNGAPLNPDFKRHYGGRNPRSNGSNFLFADGHVLWHSAADASNKLLCCMQFGSWADIRRMQEFHCGGPTGTADTRRR